MPNSATYVLLVLLAAGATLFACKQGDGGQTGSDGGVDAAATDGGRPDAAIADAGPGDAGPTGGPRFVDISCLPDVGGGQSVVDGQMVTCRFRVEGDPGTLITLSCEDDGGGPLDCSAMGTTQLQPFGGNPVPVEDGWFGTPSTGLAGSSIVVVWVADDGQNRGTYRFEAPVIADDGINEPPTITVDCAGDTDGTVQVNAGDRLDCRVFFLDADPDTLSWTYQTTSGTPVNDPGPFGGLGGAPFDIDWGWNSEPGEAGMTFVFQFEVSDGVAPPVLFDLTVDVQ